MPAEVLAIAALAVTPVPADVTVRDVMTTAVAFVGPDVALREAANHMLQRGVRALPVVGAQGEVLGLLTDGHLLTHLLPATVSALSTGQTRAVKRRSKTARAAADPGDVPVRDVMDRAVMCLADDQTVADAAALMLTKDVDRFPVTRDGALVGFVTRGDIVRKLLRP
jgi:CBS domain-containing protein